MDKQIKKVSIVMCTYNGERYLRQQLDTLLTQTYPLHEIIVQDDGSSDNTWRILSEYAASHPFIHIFHNEGEHGYNGNFFSAMQRATGDYIAICDQDDLWKPEKIEKQVTAIGSNLLCVCLTKPFSDDTQVVFDYDQRIPNYHLVRLLYASIPGHTMLFSRKIFPLLPPIDNTYYHTAYDVILASVAASYGSMAMVSEVLVDHRRLTSSVSYAKADKHRKRTKSNALYIVSWGLRYYFSRRYLVRERFNNCLALFLQIHADTTDYHDAVNILRYEASKGLLAFLKLEALMVKHRRHLFYAYENGGVGILAHALLLPIMMVYYYGQK